MNNIALALSHGMNISLRVNVGRSNLSSITELPEEFKKRGFTESEKFSYYFKAVDSPDDGITDSEVMRKLCWNFVGMDEKAAGFVEDGRFFYNFERSGVKESKAS